MAEGAKRAVKKTAKKKAVKKKSAASTGPSENDLEELEAQRAPVEPQGGFIGSPTELTAAIHSPLPPFYVVRPYEGVKQMNEMAIDGYEVVQVMSNMQVLYHRVSP